MDQECRCTPMQRISGRYCWVCFKKLRDETSPDIRVLENELNIIRMQKYRSEVVGMRFWELEREAL